MTVRALFSMGVNVLGGICIMVYTFRLFFVERFVLFQMRLQLPFHCIPICGQGFWTGRETRNSETEDLSNSCWTWPHNYIPSSRSTTLYTHAHA